MCAGRVRLSLSIKGFLSGPAGWWQVACPFWPYLPVLAVFARIGRICPFWPYLPVLAVLSVWAVLPVLADLAVSAVSADLAVCVCVCV